MGNLKDSSKILRKEFEEATGELLQSAAKQFSFTTLDEESRELMMAIVKFNNVMCRTFDYLDNFSEKIDEIHESVVKKDEKSTKSK